MVQLCRVLEFWCGQGQGIKLGGRPDFAELCLTKEDGCYYAMLRQARTSVLGHIVHPWAVLAGGPLTAEHGDRKSDA